MEIKAISDAGPIIHLSEIRTSTCFSLFSKVLVPRDVYNEVKVCNLPGNNEIESKIFEILDIVSNKKDQIEYFSTKYDISIPDGSVITLSKYTGINLVLSDDLDVRDVLKSMGMQPVGSIGILLRAYRERIISYDDAKKALEDLLDISSLYVTSRLIQRDCRISPQVNPKSVHFFMNSRIFQKKSDFFTKKPILAHYLPQYSRNYLTFQHIYR